MFCCQPGNGVSVVCFHESCGISAHGRAACGIFTPMPNGGMLRNGLHSSNLPRNLHHHKLVFSIKHKIVVSVLSFYRYLVFYGLFWKASHPSCALGILLGKAISFQNVQFLLGVCWLAESTLSCKSFLPAVKSMLQTQTLPWHPWMYCQDSGCTLASLANWRVLGPFMNIPWNGFARTKLLMFSLLRTIDKMHVSFKEVETEKAAVSSLHLLWFFSVLAVSMK